MLLRWFFFFYDISNKNDNKCTQYTSATGSLKAAYYSSVYCIQYTALCTVYCVLYTVLWPADELYETVDLSFKRGKIICDVDSKIQILKIIRVSSANVITFLNFGELLIRKQ